MQASRTLLAALALGSSVLSVAGYTGTMVLPFYASTSTEAVQELIAFCALGACILAPGYLAGFSLRQLDLCNARERLLWTLALGVPIAVAISVWFRRFVSRAKVDDLFAVLLLIAAFVLLFRWRQARPKPATRPRVSGSLLLLCGLGLLFALYCFTETLDLQTPGHLYLSTLITDWSVRIGIVEGAIHSGVPPLNGLSTVSPGGLGAAPHLRYYYFWYVLVAQVAGSLHLGAQPTLAASCIWAGWGFLSACFLALKYLADVRQRWTQACLVLLGLFAVLGLDILPTAVMWLSRSFHPLMEMEWWRADRTPSFLGMVLASPHHVAGFGSLLTGTLVLLRLQSPVSDNTARRPSEWVAAAVLAGLLFATASGLSLFPTLCFAIGLTLWAVDLLRRRQWASLGSLAGSGAIALLLAHGYLTELSSGSSAADGLLGLAWRSNSFAGGEIPRFLPAAWQYPAGAAVLRQCLVALLDFMELGFYLFVLCAAVRQDLLRPGRLSPSRCAWWALLLGAALPCFFLSSTPTKGPNDLGFDAGFLFRLCLQLWAVDWVRTQWRERNQLRGSWPRLAFAGALCLAILGLSAQVYQALSIRLYFPLVGSGWAHKQVDVLTQDHLAERLYNIRAALRQFDREVPPSRPDTEAVQFNPIGPLLPPQIYFNTHQVASWDTGCGTSFGGDYARCAPIYASLLYLFGNTEAGIIHSRAQNTSQDGAAARVATSADLAAVCKSLQLRAVIADATDSIWAHHDSWVWTGPVLVANSTVRVIGCPAGSWRP